MSRTLTPGTQSFERLRVNNYFYIDKTKFIQDWWNNGIDVTLITRPRRFGKTLMLDTVKTFFSTEFAGRSDLFEGLEIWNNEKFRNLQGTISVIFLSFAKFNNDNYFDIIARIKAAISSIYGSFASYIDINAIPDAEKELFTSVCLSMPDSTAQDAIYYLCKFITMQHKIRPIILLDEYDTPLQEAWLHNYWDKLVNFMRGFMNSTFKTNPYLERGLITGITRVAKESIFSDMNNLEVVGTTSRFYTDCFGFTEQEVFQAMDEFELTQKEKVKYWYDGFNFGKSKEIYNPWSILNYLKNQEFTSYWANTTSNKMISDLIIKSDEDRKDELSKLIQGDSIITKMNEEIIFTQLDEPAALWSLLMSAGYLKPTNFNLENKEYELTLTNHEIYEVFETLITNWFKNSINFKRKFLNALLSDDLDSMNINLKHVTQNTFSVFDINETEPEKFYHGFVLGLIVDLKEDYIIKSNRESGYGRYDIMMIPRRANYHGIIIEFKTLDQKSKNDLEKTCQSALEQIKTKDYISELLDHNIAANNIYIYGIVFQGKDILIRGGLEANI
ncbi:MAG: AAA family ATPase [Desulfovibrionaceae bacterium]|nr:AAA family ATPase [Desulfovibrionaceae bacterium]